MIMASEMLKFVCVFICFNVVFCQFGFFPQREDRRFSSPFGFTQNIFSGPKRFKDTLSGILHYRPEDRGNNAQFMQHNNQQRPIFIGNSYDLNPPEYPYNQPSNVRFPSQVDVPNDSVNFDEPRSTQNTDEQFPPTNNENTDSVQPVSTVSADNIKPNDVTIVNVVSNDKDETAPVINDAQEPNEQGGLITGHVNKGFQENIPSFEDRNGIPNVPPPFDTTTRLPELTPVPPTESRYDVNFGAPGQFHETCQTVDGGVGSCVSLAACQPYLQLLQQAKTNPANVQVLRKAHCGFDGSNPKVCCPRAEIPTAPPITAAPVTSAPVTAAPTASVKSVPPGDFITALPEPPECGVTNATFSRVVGGIPAKLGDFPWMALLGYRERRSMGTRWLCGGSLISSRHALTAAHCIHNHEDDLYLVRLGELDISREDDGATPVDVLIKSKIKHEEYSPKSFTNDIGVLLLERDVEFTNLIRPICIPKDSELRARSFEDYNPIIAGWGDTEFRGPSANHLQVLQLPVVSNSECAAAYARYKAQVIDERVLCAGYKNGGKDACQGDSGGPLMQPIWNPQTYKTYFYQIGVVSFGKKCAEAGFPGVYSRVTNFVPWLEKTLLGV